MGRPRKYQERRVATAIRIPTDLHARLADEAENRDVSVNHLICKAAAYYLDFVLDPIPGGRQPMAPPRVPEPSTIGRSEP